MNRVKIEALPESVKNERGVKYLVPSFESKALGIYYRNKGAVSGRHYHKGTDPTKNPERHVLISGEAELYTKDLMTGEEATQKMTAPVVWEVGINIYHEVRALTDIIFLEQKMEEKLENYDVFFL